MRSIHRLNLIWALFLSPALLAQSAPATQPDTDLLPAIRHCRTLLLAAQLPDGAFAMTGAPARRVRIVPYFATNAAIALLAAHRADPHPDSLAAVRRWIDFYADHMEPDGTIYDFAGTPDHHPRTDKRDSTDSYASTYLQVLARYALADPAAAPVLLPRARRALAAIELTLDPDDHLTWAKPDYKMKYLMDNIEVALALSEIVPFFRAAGDNASAATADQIRTAAAPSIAAFYHPDAACYAFAKGPSGQYHLRLEKWYPDALVNLFAAAHLPATPRNLWPKLQSTFAADANLLPAHRLPAARKLASPADIARYRDLTLADALASTPKTPINHLATTLSALLP